MSHGLPVISSNLPSSKEIMGDFGVYFENGNIKDLAKKMMEITQCNWGLKSKQAIELVEKFNIENSYKKWQGLIESL